MEKALRRGDFALFDNLRRQYDRLLQTREQVTAKTITDTMSKEDIEHTRQTFSKAANSKAWKESYGEMCKKTVLRRLCKLIDLNFDTAEQCQAFEDGSAFDVKEKPKEKYQARDIYQSQDQSSHNGDEDSDGVIDGTFKEVDE